MSRRPRLVVAAVVAASWVPMVVANAPASKAATGLEAASWWRAQPSGGSVPAPPQVPSGGLWVSTDATGASAVSAIRVSPAADEKVTLFALHVHTNAPPGSAAVAACPAAKSWTKTNAGAWDARPTTDCTKGSTVGQLSPDGNTMVFHVDTMAFESGPDLVLFPTAAANPTVPTPPVPVGPNGGPAAPTFDITFDPPTMANIAIEKSPAPDVAAGGATSPDTVASPDLSSAPALAPAVEAPSLSLGPQVPTAGSAAPAARTVVRRPVLRVRPRPRLVRSTDDRGARVVAGAAFVALAAWAAQLFWGEGNPQRAARRRLTVYETPSDVPVSDLRRRFGVPAGRGEVPALR